MKKLFTNFIRPISMMLLLLTVASSCKKSQTTDPTPTPTSNATGTIDGKTINVAESGLTTTYFNTSGDNVSALLTSAALDNSGSKMDFYIPDISVSSNTISPKLGTSSNPGNPFLKVQAATSTTTQVYVAYSTGGNVYYAISGTVTVTVDGSNITVKWTLNFTDASNRSFTSTGSFVVYNFKAVLKPKNQIVDPTPVSAKPTIGDIALNVGVAGDVVSIAGTNFSTNLTDNVVKFNGVAATVRTATATSLTVTVPTGTTGAVTVKVLNSETATGPIFTYVLPATISAITPLTGVAGTTVTITGTNFSTTSTDNAVLFNGTAATVTNVSATSITVTVPAAATTGAVTLKVKGRDAALNSGVSNTFTVIPTANISAMSPTNGIAGTAVTLTGTNFATALADNVVLFNGTQGTVTAATTTSITVTAPAGVSTGLVTLKVKGFDATISPNPISGGPAINIFSVIGGTGSYGTAGQAYGLTTSFYGPTFKAVDGYGYVWAVNGSGLISKMNYTGGDALISYTAANLSTAMPGLTSYVCGGLAKDANGTIHAYIYGSTATSNPVAVISISNTGVISKDFDSNFSEKGSQGFAMDFLSNIFMISNRYGTNDIIRLKYDGTSEIYLKGGTGADNTLGGANAYDVCVDGAYLYVLTYTAGSTNAGAAIYRFDSSKNRTLIATLPDGGFADGALASSKFSGVTYFAVSGNNIFIADNGNLRIRKLDQRTNTISTVAGNGLTGTTYSGDALSTNIIPGGLLADPTHAVFYNFANTNTHTMTRIAY